MLFVHYDNAKPQLTSMQKLITLFCFFETFRETGATWFCNSRSNWFLSQLQLVFTETDLKIHNKIKTF